MTSKEVFLKAQQIEELKEYWKRANDDVLNNSENLLIDLSAHFVISDYGRPEWIFTYGALNKDNFAKIKADRSTHMFLKRLTLALLFDEEAKLVEASRMVLLLSDLDTLFPSNEYPALGPLSMISRNE